MKKEKILPIALLLLILTAVSGSLEGRVLLSIPEAIQKAFHGQVTFTRQRLFLSSSRVAAFEDKAAGTTSLKSRIITRFKIHRKKRLIAMAYLDTHHVRSGKETLLIVLNIEGAINNIFLLNFQGDRGYEPKAQWLKNFTGLTENKRLRLKHEIDAMSGASITSVEVIKAVRRVLLLHSLSNGE